MPELTPARLLEELGGRALRPVYYLSGEEQHGKAAALEALARAHDVGPFSRQDFRGESLDADELVSVCRTLPMLGPLRIVVVRRAEKLHAEARRRLAEYLRDPQPATCLILLAEERKPERGEALATLAFAKGAVATFWPRREGEALDWIRAEFRKAGARISEEAVHALLEEVGPDLLLLDQEIGKLLLMVKGKKGEIGREEVLSSLGCHQAESVYSLGRALQVRDAKEAVRLLRELLDAGEEPLALLAQASWTLARQLKARRLLSAGIAGEAAFRELKVSSYYNRDFLELAGRVPEPALVAGLKDCLETEARLKTGAPSPALEVEGLLLRLCGAARREAGGATAGARPVG